MTIFISLLYTNNSFLNVLRFRSRTPINFYLGNFILFLSQIKAILKIICHFYIVNFIKLLCKFDVMQNYTKTNTKPCYNKILKSYKIVFIKNIKLLFYLLIITIDFLYTTS